MCAEILPDERLSAAHWECNNRILIKTSHSLLSAVWVIITLDNKNHITGDCRGAGRLIQEQCWEQSVIHKMCTQERAKRYTEQTSVISIYLFIPADCYT